MALLKQTAARSTDRTSGLSCIANRGQETPCFAVSDFLSRHCSSGREFCGFEVEGGELYSRQILGLRFIYDSLFWIIKVYC